MSRISVDASYQDGHAGIAAALEGRDARALFLDVVRSRHSGEGEKQALLKAMRIARDAGWRSVTFRTDCSALRRTWDERRADRLEGWRLEVVERRRNRAAHVLARETLRVWLAGLAGRHTCVESVPIPEAVPGAV